MIKKIQGTKEGFKDWSNKDIQDTIEQLNSDISLTQSDRDFVISEAKRRKIEYET